jgi:hypothetical protein
VWLTKVIFVEELEHVVLPHRGGFVQSVVAIVSGLTHGRINFEQVRLVEVLKCSSQVAPGSGAVVVLGMDQHDWGVCLAKSGQQALA